MRRIIDGEDSSLVLHQELQSLTKTRVDLDTARQSLSVSEQIVVYLSITLDQTNPLIQGLLRHWAESRKEVEKLRQSINYQQYLLICRKLRSSPWKQQSTKVSL